MPGVRLGNVFSSKGVRQKRFRMAGLVGSKCKSHSKTEAVNSGLKDSLRGEVGGQSTERFGFFILVVSG